MATIDSGTLNSLNSHHDAAGLIATLMNGHGFRHHKHDQHKTVLKDQSGSKFLIANDDTSDFAGTKGSETLIGNDHGNFISGGRGHDAVWAGGGHDVVNGGLGKDWADGGSGNDLLNGGGGTDTLFGGTGHDTLYGGLAADTLDGGAGNDTLEGGAGNDTLSGGAGNDTLSGGAGNDTLDGGAGNDTFIFGELGGSDVITDFTQGDAIQWADNLSVTGITYENGNAVVTFTDTDGNTSKVTINNVQDGALQQTDTDNNGDNDTIQL